MPSLEQPPDFIKLLAHELRWNLLRALVESDHRVHELVAHVQQPMNLVSYHLKRLRSERLVTTRRSEADGRDVYYSINLARLNRLYREAGMALHPALTLKPGARVLAGKVQSPLRVLVVCTNNSARSQMAEGLLRALSAGQVEVHSAGSQPSTVHPLAIRTMDRVGIDIRAQYSKHIDRFTGQRFDYVITVCDRAREVCPTFPHGARSVHWGLPDPDSHDDPQQREQAFDETERCLRTRIEYFLNGLMLNDAFNGQPLH